ncbi:hypothetical protein [uncultured Elizabethkingia sp.]|uniref:hypothetical protein n=1 Tax=uncultured Elizabethkingia sp. TaxID=432638 RepID=UPI002593C586|nr:hypothetical protein [uncultured Elizabethkingia sp.]
MKKIFFLLVFSSIYIFPQKYLILDSIKTKFKVQEYTLNTKELYNIDKKIEVYNVFIDPKNILLLSILPKLEAQIPKTGSVDYNQLAQAMKKTTIEKNINWKKIDFEQIKSNILSIGDINILSSEWELQNLPGKKTFKYQLVKKMDNDYYVSENCLTEFFTIANVQSPLISSYGTINIAEQKVTIKQMEEIFKKRFPKFPFPLDIREQVGIRYLDINFSVHNYFSKEYLIKGNKAYQFWTLDGWWYNHGPSEYRGIDRFVYISGKGIVGGSYDFYFRKFNILNTLLWDNIINEKVMIAEELK